MKLFISKFGVIFLTLLSVPIQAQTYLDGTNTKTEWKCPICKATTVVMRVSGQFVYKEDTKCYECGQTIRINTAVYRIDCPSCKTPFSLCSKCAHSKGIAEALF